MKNSDFPLLSPAINRTNALIIFIYHLSKDYAEPDEILFKKPLESPTNFENVAYLTALRLNNKASNNNRKSNYENLSPYSNGELETDEGGTKPLMTSTNLYESIAPDADKNNENYEPLSNSERPTYHTISTSPNDADDNEFYEDMSPKGGTV